MHNQLICVICILCPTEEKGGRWKVLLNDADDVHDVYNDVGFLFISRVHPVGVLVHTDVRYKSGPRVAWEAWRLYADIHSVMYVTRAILPSVVRKYGTLLDARSLTLPFAAHVVHSRSN